MNKNLTRRGFIGVAATAGAAAVLAGCSSGSGSASGSASASASGSASGSGSTSAAKTTLRFVTGGEGGTYYAFGSVIAQHCTNNTNVEVRALAGNGSKANVEALEDNDADLAFCQSDVMAYAYKGINVFDGVAIDCFSTVANLYEEQVQIVTCNPDIKTVADLKGKRISIGAPGSGVYFNAVDILGVYGIKAGETPADCDFTPSYQSFNDSTDSLKNDQIDAAFIVAGAPTNSINDLSTSKQAYLVALDSEHVQELKKASSYYNEAVIKGGTYNGIGEDVTTVSIGAVILANDSVSEDAVYTFVSDIFDNAADLTDSHAKYAELSLEKGASITAVPYHPGAAKYFDEKGFKVESK